VIGSCVTKGTPSWKKSSNSTPWKWTPVVSFRLLVKMARTLSPWLTRIVGPRRLLVVAEGGDRIHLFVDLLRDLVDGQPEDLHITVNLGRQRVHCIAEDQLRDLGERRFHPELRIAIGRTEDVGELG